MVSFLSLCGPATRAENAQILSDAKREGETRCKIRGRICHKDSAFLREMSCDSKKTKAIYTSDCPSQRNNARYLVTAATDAWQPLQKCLCLRPYLVCKHFLSVKSDSLLFFLTEIVFLGTCNSIDRGGFFDNSNIQPEERTIDDMLKEGRYHDSNERGRKQLTHLWDFRVKVHNPHGCEHDEHHHPRSTLTKTHPKSLLSITILE